jgi:xanthine/CO dehydrogenase XdhC/CoxF family maturation factor
VVRAEMPTSARPGDAAIIVADGSIEGFVGGQCAESSVQMAALNVLESGEALLLRILPEGGAEFPERPGAQAIVNPCLSGGAIEVFLEPKLPAATLSIVGSTPIAEALVQFGTQLGYAIDHVPNCVANANGALAVLISSHGKHEEDSIRAALDAEVGFIGLVASGPHHLQGDPLPVGRPHPGVRHQGDPEAEPAGDAVDLLFDGAGIRVDVNVQHSITPARPAGPGDSGRSRCSAAPPARPVGPRR